MKKSDRDILMESFPTESIVTGAAPMLQTHHHYLSMPDEDPHIFNMYTLLEILKPLDCQLLEKATFVLLARHDALRYRFVHIQNEWKATIDGLDTAIPFSRIDLSSVDAEVQSMAIEHEIEKLQSTLSLANGPLMRIAYFYLGENRSARLLFIVHHFATDGFSQAILLKDFFRAYHCLSRGEPLRLPGKTSSLKEYAEALSTYAQSSAEQEFMYWVTQERRHFPPLPVDFPENMQQYLVRGSVLMKLARERTKDLLALEKAGVSVNLILLTAMYTMHRRWTGREAMLIDCINNGRFPLFKGISLLRTSGHISYMVPYLLSTDTPADLGKALKDIKRIVREVPCYGIGYHALTYLGNPAMREVFRALPFPQLHMNYRGKSSARNDPSSWIRRAREQVRGEQSSRRIDPLGIWLFIDIEDEILTIQWDYHQEIYKQSTIENLISIYTEELLKAIAFFTRSDDRSGHSLMADPQS